MAKRKIDETPRIGVIVVKSGHTSSTSTKSEHAHENRRGRQTPDPHGPRFIDVEEHRKFMRSLFALKNEAI